MVKAELTTLERTERRTKQAPARNDFYDSLRSTDVFLCGYPKSGTTWLGYLIGQLLKTDDGQLAIYHNHVPDVNLSYSKGESLRAFADRRDPRFFLCHACYDARLPKVVYILRDPRDTMVSYWHFKQLIEKDFNQTLLEFIRSEDHWPCDWDQHVTDWLLPQRHPNFMAVKYEQMHEDAEKVLKSVLDFAGVPYTPQKIDAAVEASRFERMRAAEDQHDKSWKKGNQHERFIRKGRVGSWQEEMGYAELRALEEKYGDVMRRAGYQPMS